MWDNAKITEWANNRSSNRDETLRENFFEYITMEKRGDIIWAAYHNRAKFSKNGISTGEGYWLESLVAVPTDDGWRLKMMHSTRVPRKE